jgi:carbon storage regulator CsrA
MLVLTRKANQQIRLGDDITITVLKVNNGSIRLGIDAPRDVRILRSEIEQYDEPTPAECGSSAGGQKTATANDAAPQRHVYQLRGKLNNGRLKLEADGQDDARGSARQSEQQSAPLARFLPPLPPAVNETSAQYHA